VGRTIAARIRGATLEELKWKGYFEIQPRVYRRTFLETIFKSEN